MNKKIIICLIAIIVIALLSVLFIKFSYKKESSSDDNNTIEEVIETPSEEEIKLDKTSYSCIKDGIWTSSSVSEYNGHKLGKVKKTYMLSFESLTGKHISNTVYTIRYEFEDIYAYDYLEISSEGFTRKVDQDKLIKEYSSKEILPILISNDDTPDTFIVKLSSDGYGCSKVEQ